MFTFLLCEHNGAALMSSSLQCGNKTNNTQGLVLYGRMGEFNLSISYVESHSAESDKKPYAQDDLHDSK